AGCGRGARGAVGGGDRLFDEWSVRRLAIAAVELEPEVEVAATLQREARDLGAAEVTADGGHRPRDRRVAQEVEVRRERGGGGREAQRRAAQAPPGPHGELHPPATGEPALPEGAQRRVQEAGLVDRQARAQAELVVVGEHLLDPVERVLVHERPGREAVVAATAEVHRTGIEQTETKTRLGEWPEVAEAD